VLVLLCAILCIFLISRAVPRKAPPAAPTMPDARKVAGLAEALEREWREGCRKRLQDAGEAAFSPLAIEQGENSRLSYGERKRRAQEKALLREAQVRREIEDEEKYQLLNLKSFAELAIRCFGDVADDDAPEIRSLKRHETAVGERIGDPEWLKTSYADLLLARSRGFSPRIDGKLADFENYLRGLPKQERTLWRRRMVFERLRTTSLNGKALLTNDFPHGFPTPDTVGRHLDAVAGYLNTL